MRQWRSALGSRSVSHEVAMSDVNDDDEWREVWDARLAALEGMLGKAGDSVFHSAIPFQFRDIGGTADVVPFPHHVPGATYVTAELTGAEAEQRPSSLGNYELMICTRDELPAAASFVSQLAGYTCHEILEPGATMDIGGYFGDDALRAMVFANATEPASAFDVCGQRCGLLLCVGITETELSFARAHGSAPLLALLKEQGVFPYTIPGRASLELPGEG